MSIDKAIAEITEADLAALITARVTEGKSIEYKREINLVGSDASRKFLAGVVSFANTQGGDIVFGMEADKGVAKALHPLPNFNPDQDCIRLRDFIRAHIEPKLYGFHLHPVPLAAGGHVLVLRIPRTWVGAHMVTFNQDNRFYSRDANGRRLMDAGEVRMAFSSQEALPERMRRFRLDRLSAIAAGDVSFPLTSSQALVFHIVPVKAFDSLNQCDLDALLADDQKSNDHLRIYDQYNRQFEFDLDGVMKLFLIRGQQCLSYTKLFRSGVLEVLDAYCVEPVQGRSDRVFWTARYERQIWEQFPKWLASMRVARIEPPAFISLSFIGMVGMLPVHTFRFNLARPIRHDPLLIPPVLVDSMDPDPTATLMPLFNRVWQACGLPHSINFDASGKWKDS